MRVQPKNCVYAKCRLAMHATRLRRVCTTSVSALIDDRPDTVSLGRRVDGSTGWCGGGTCRHDVASTACWIQCQLLCSHTRFARLLFISQSYGKHKTPRTSGAQISVWRIGHSWLRKHIARLFFRFSFHNMCLVLFYYMFWNMREAIYVYSLFKQRVLLTVLLWYVHKSKWRSKYDASKGIWIAVCSPRDIRKGAQKGQNIQPLQRTQMCHCEMTANTSTRANKM